MALGVALLAGLLAGLARGGRFRALAALPIRWLWLPIVAYALQILCVKLNLLQGAPLGIFSPWVVSSLALAAFALRNLRLPGLPLILLGLGLNTLAMAANGGYMPATPEVLVESGHGDQVVNYGVGRPIPYTKEIALNRDQTRLWPFTDILISPQAPYRLAFSVGDVVLVLGGVYFAYRGMRPRRPVDPASEPGPDTASVSELANTN